MVNRGKSTWLIHCICIIVACTIATTQADEPLEPSDFELAPQTIVYELREITSFALSPDTKHLVSSHEDHRIVVRKFATGETQKVLDGHSGLVACVKFSPDGNHLASVSYDKSVRLWDGHTFEAQATLTGHKSRVVCAAFSTDSKLLATSGYDHTVRIWDVAKRRSVIVLKGHDKTVRAVAFSVDGNTLVSGCDNGSLKFWNISDWRERDTVVAHSGPIRAIAFSPDGRKLATSSETGSAKIWEMSSAKDARPSTKPVQVLSENSGNLAHDSMICSLSFSSQGHTLATGDFVGKIKLWDVATGRHIQSLTGHLDAITSISFSSRSTILVTSGLDKRILLWRAKLPSHSPLATIDIAEGKVWAITASPDGKTFAAAGRKGFVSLWDLSTGRKLKQLEGYKDTIDCLEYSRDGKLLAAAGWRSKQIDIWQTDTGNRLISMTLNGLVRAVSFSPDGRELAIALKNRSLQVWDVSKGKQKTTTVAHVLPVYDVEYSPDGRLLATCSGDWTMPKPGMVKLWNVKTMKEFASFPGHKSAVRSLVFDDAGQWLASAGENGTIKVWDIATRSELATLKNSAGVRPIDFSSTGQLAVGLHDGTVNVWDVNQAQVIRRFDGATDMFAIRFMPDGSVIIGASGEKIVHFWEVPNSKETKSLELIRGWSRLQQTK